MSGLATSAEAASTDGIEVLRICADPDNLPFSNERLEGFDNRIAALIADDLGARVEYAWASLRRGFLRQTLEADRCDVVMGTPAPLPGTTLTPPYYASSYVFVYRSESAHAIDSFDDPVLKESRIGLHAINAGGANPPPARSLSVRGLQGNVTGYSPWGATGESQALGKVVEATASGEIDVAVVWGPIGGYFAHRHEGLLSVQPVLSDVRHPEWSFVQTISIGVRNSDDKLRQAIAGVLDRKREAIRAILADYSVPLVDEVIKAASADGSTIRIQYSHQ